MRHGINRGLHFTAQCSVWTQCALLGRPDIPGINSIIPFSQPPNLAPRPTFWVTTGVFEKGFFRRHWCHWVGNSTVLAGTNIVAASATKSCTWSALQNLITPQCLVIPCPHVCFHQRTAASVFHIYTLLNHQKGQWFDDMFDMVFIFQLTHLYLWSSCY